MRTIKEFLANNQVVEYNKIEDFISKRNAVALFAAISQDGWERHFVEKTLETNADCDFEKWFLMEMFNRDVRVPRIMAADPKRLLLNYIEGEDLCTALVRLEEQNADFRPPLAALKNWLLKYYQASAALLSCPVSCGDVNLRNFIYTPQQQIYGLDFEGSDIQKDLEMPEKDVAAICAYLLLYDPIATDYKKKAVEYFLSLWADVDYFLIVKCFREHLTDLAERRKITLPQELLYFLDQYYADKI